MCVKEHARPVAGPEWRPASHDLELPFRLSRPLDALPKPLGEFVFAQLSGGERFEQHGQFGIARRERTAVVDYECFADDQGRSLIPVYEGVVLCQPISVACGEIGQVRIIVCSEILGSSERALK